MIDFHTHIIPAIDDGVKTIDDTIEVIKEAKKAGFTAIISTSHYLEGNYEAREEQRKEYIKQIKSKLYEKNSEIEIYLGSEIYISYNMLQLIKEKKASTINNSRYVLFELPRNDNVIYLKQIVNQLLEEQYIPIIAHPERYSYVQKNPNMLLELIEKGVLIQSNYGSFIGKYGKHAKKTVKILLKHNMIHFLGSDVHRPKAIYINISKAIEEIKKIIGSEKFKQITEENPKLVLDDKTIKTDLPQRVKIGFWRK